MADVNAVRTAAEKLACKDEAALELLLGLQEKAIAENPALADDPYLAPQYDPHMGLIDNLKSAGRRVALRWAKELHDLVCGSKRSDEEDRQKILNALNLGETAVIGAVAAALMPVLPAPVAAAAALIVKRFIWPAHDELCKQGVGGSPSGWVTGRNWNETTLRRGGSSVATAAIEYLLARN